MRRHAAIVSLLGLLLIAAVLFLSSCRTTRPTEPAAPVAVAPVDTTGMSPTSVSATPLPDIRVGQSTKPTGVLGFISKVVGSTGKTKYKHVTINQVSGTSNTVSTTGNKASSATGTGATNAPVDKAKAPVATGTGAKSTDQSNTGTAATVDGNGNQLEQTATTKEAPDSWAVLTDNLTSWIPYVATGAALLLGFWLWRKKKQAETIIS